MITYSSVEWISIMKIVVQKYGGSSVSSPEKLLNVAKRVVRTRQTGYSVVVVVSAMGNTTNQLLELAKQVSPEPHHRELDMLVTVGERISMALLSMAIQDLGEPAVSFTGSQSGIITTNTHTNARIIKVRPRRIQQALHLGQVVIVAGFQGVSEQLEITSLGRGGSDTTAVALAASLSAEYAEICSDVDGVYSTDPRISPKAIKVDQLDYEEMQVLADSGAKVLNAEAVEWAKRSGIDIHCSCTHGDPHSRTTIALRPDQAEEHIHRQSLISAVTQHSGLYVLIGQGEPPLSLYKYLAQSGIADAELNCLHLSWILQIPMLNVHQPEDMKQRLFEITGLYWREDLTSVSIIGRGLIAVDDLYMRAHELLTRIIPSPLPLRINAAAISWMVPTHLAPKVVRTLHDALVIDHP